MTKTKTKTTNNLNMDNSNNSNMETLENLLDNHDWFYSRSEDHRKWINGIQSEEAIKDEMDRLGNTKEVIELYESKNKNLQIENA